VLSQGSERLLNWAGTLERRTQFPQQLYQSQPHVSTVSSMEGLLSLQSTQ
jgi:hypothetical protein